jgi:hypothetical protein
MLTRIVSPFRSFQLQWLAVLLLVIVSQTFAQPESEQQLEAAYLINFLKYIEWPAGNRKETSICLFGRDTLGPFLSRLEGRLIVGRALRIRRVNSPDDMGNCQIVYIPDVEEARIGAVLRWIDGMSILAVSNADGFARSGGGVELVRLARRIQFIVNSEALSQHGLTPSSQMMRLAHRIIGGER